MLPTVRFAVAVIAAAIFVGGLVGIIAGEALVGLWAVAIGAAGIIAVALERSRYRSAAAEHSTEEPGPGGGEPEPPGLPFRPTGERFVDPTSGRRMRVYVNPATGERRYHADM
jgi:hypothetical protein